MNHTEPTTKAPTSIRRRILDVIAVVAAMLGVLMLAAAALWVRVAPIASAPVISVRPIATMVIPYYPPALPPASPPDATPKPTPTFDYGVPPDPGHGPIPIRTRPSP